MSPGSSEKPNSGLTLQELIDELEEKLAYLKAGVEKDVSKTAASSSDD